MQKKSLAVSIGVFIVAVFSRLSDVDFIMTRIDDPGWLGEMARHAINAPIWVTVIFVLVGFGLIAFAYRRAETAKQPFPWKFNCGQHITGSMQQTRFQDGRLVVFYRIEVINAGNSPIIGASGYLTDVEKNGEPQHLGESVQLTFAPGESDDALSKKIPVKIPQFLDVAYLAEDGGFGLGTKGRTQLFSVADIFKEPADYKLTIQVTANNTPTATIEARLYLTGEIGTTVIECLAVNI